MEILKQRKKMLLLEAKCSVPFFENEPKKFDFAHWILFCWRRRTQAGHKTRVIDRRFSGIPLELSKAKFFEILVNIAK